MTIHSEISDTVRGYLHHDQSDLEIAAKTAEIKRALTNELNWVRVMQENAIRRALIVGGYSVPAVVSVTGLSEDEVTRLKLPSNSTR